MNATRTRTLTCHSPAMPSLMGQPALVPVRIEGTESLSQLYRYTILLSTPDNPALSELLTARVPFKELVGKEFTVGIELDGNQERQISGIVTAARFVQSQDRRSLYEITLEPWLTLATKTSDFKVFQNKTALQIIRTVLSDYNFPTESRCAGTGVGANASSYPPLDYQVQYGQSDYAFITRLMQEWGIYYFFEHTGSAHRLVLVDAAGAHQPNSGAAYQQVSYYPPGHQIDEEHINLRKFGAIKKLMQPLNNALRTVRNKEHTMNTKKPFIEARRQQLLGEDYYKKLVPYYEKTIEDDLTDTSTQNNDDEYNSGEVLRWGSIADSRFFLLFLAYTAGEPIESLGAMLEGAVEAREKEQKIGSEYFVDPCNDVLGGGGESFLGALQYIGLAYLLHRRDLLPRIEVLMDGLDGSVGEADDIYEKLLRFNNPKRKVPNQYINEDYVDLENALYEQNTKDEALKDLTSYLKDWYKMHKGHLWHDSHLIDYEMGYCGYWAFEAAAVVYLLDLDDSKLGKYLYYPKDLVAYARARGPVVPSLQAPTALAAMPSTICTKAGIWFCPNDGLREINMKVGETFPAADRGLIGGIIWYWKSL